MDKQPLTKTQQAATLDANAVAAAFDRAQADLSAAILARGGTPVADPTEWEEQKPQTMAEMLEETWLPFAGYTGGQYGAPGMKAGHGGTGEVREQADTSAAYLNAPVSVSWSKVQKLLPGDGTPGAKPVTWAVAPTEAQIIALENSEPTMFEKFKDVFAAILARPKKGGR